MKIMAGSRLGKGKYVSGKMQKEASSRDSHLSHPKARQDVTQTGPHHLSQGKHEQAP